MGAALSGKHTQQQHIYDYIVIGAGPGGLQIAYYLEQAGRDYIVLEKGNVSGSFYTKYPRHGTLISINKRYTGKTNKEFNLRHDWNSLLSHDDQLLFKHYSKEMFPPASAFVDYLANYTSKLGLNVQYQTEISNLRRVFNDSSYSYQFTMDDQNGRIYNAKTVIVATGIASPRIVDFPGSEHLDYYHNMTIDPEHYEGKSVLILGRGNSAFETAQAIYGHTNMVHMASRNRVRLAWATHYVGDIRAVNTALLDTYQLKSLDGILEIEVQRDIALQKKDGRLMITARNSQNSTELPKFDNLAMREPYDHVISCLGFNFDFDISPNLTTVLSQKYPAIDHGYESIEIPGLYFAGTNTHSVDRRKSSGGFIHGFRYTARALHRLLEWRNHGVTWPYTTYDVTDIVSAILKRINEVSGTYQMFTMLVDIVIFRNNSQKADLIQEYPVNLLAELEERTGIKPESMIVINSEYGRGFSGPNNDVFAEGRATIDPSNAHRSNFLHPVFYYYKTPVTAADMMEAVSQKEFLPRPDRLHLMVEDFHTSWDAPRSHILPLRRFIETITKQDLKYYTDQDCMKQALLYTDISTYCQNAGIQTLTEHSLGL